MSAFKKAPVTGGRPRKDVLASLKMAQLVASNPVLPAEILETIIDYVTISDLMRFARTSKKMQEMVYDDSKWVQRMRRMGCWNEVEARMRAEQKGTALHGIDTGEQRVRKSIESEGIQKANGAVPAQSNSVLTNGDGDPGGTMHREPSSMSSTVGRRSISDGFDAINLSAPNTIIPSKVVSKQSVLQIFQHVRSIRGQARQEYSKIYAALGPYYIDTVNSDGSDCLVFQHFDKPEDQAQMLSHLGTLSKTDCAVGWLDREMKLDHVISAFETAALREFRQGYENVDVDGQMRQYAHVLGNLNGGQAAIELFVHHNHLITQKEKFGSPMACIDQQGNILLARLAGFFDRLSMGWTEEVSIIDRAFPSTMQVVEPFLEKIGAEIISPFLSTVFDEIHERNMESYLKAVAGTFAQSLQFAKDLRPSQNSGDEFYEGIEKVVGKAFEPHVDLYLMEELEFFRTHSETEIDNWDRALSEQAASTESFLMSNVNRVQDKRDFLTSFKKVVMMPVNILPSLPTFSSKPTTAKALANEESLESGETTLSTPPSRSSTPMPFSRQLVSSDRSSTPVPIEAPTNELVARAAIMNSKLEGIRSLFSIEVALDIVHTAKASLERAAQFIKLGDDHGKAAQQQCEAIFVLLLQVLGIRHVKAGFDKAVSHLSHFNPREQSEHSAAGVEPLVTFLELVNVGDLIQQMLDVFYEQELVSTNITDRNDFLDPAVKEKKKFEQMLDERVAAGLNKGIDVLMDQVDYIMATSQATTDFNPPDNNIMDVGPTPTSIRVVESVSSHTKMLTGSTDKALLDVFNSEVGLRLFGAVIKNLKRHRISTSGSIRLIADMTNYFNYVSALKNPDLLQYFIALRELSQIYLIDGKHAKEIAEVIADGERWRGVFRAEEVYEFAERRADWYQIRRGVERAMYGIGCGLM